jgi:VWFA-related protein
VRQEKSNMSPARSIRRILALLTVASVFALNVWAQQTSDDVVRVNTELVQTDFMVFDKQGNFVDGLKRDQFVLKVDGKPRDISFFDRIAAGSRSEEAQLSAARGMNSNTAPVPLDRGRTVLFFVDDLHLSLASLAHTRELLRHFVANDMGQNDHAEIACASDQLGFLQQLTDNKAVLLSAADRLRYQQIIDSSGSEYPPMTEYQSMQIERGDPDLLNFLIDKLIERSGRIPRIQAEQIIRGRARQMIEQGVSVVARSIGALKGFINLVEPLPGRKIVFFISDGFLVDQNRRENWERLQRVTSAAARSGVVIYSIDARGVTGAPEPTEQDRTLRDPRGILDRANSGEIHATQDGLSSLAGDTGGRAFFNTNSMEAPVATALKESATYYLLAWRPDSEDQRSQRFRKIELAVVGRPDLTVRFRRGFGEPPEETVKSKEQAGVSVVRKSPDDEIKALLSAPYPSAKLPVAISLNFVDTAQFGGTLSTDIKVGAGSLGLEEQPDGAVAALDLAIVVLDDHGKSVSNYQRRFTLKASPKNKTKLPESVSYDHVAKVKPGLYQVRVAAIDVKNGTRGSAYEWIEVPNIANKQLTLSSLVVGERKTGKEVQPTAQSADAARQPEPLKEVPVNADRKFASSSYLRVLTFIYNAAVGASAATPATSATGAKPKPVPDLAVQVQVFRDNEPVITTPLHKIQTDGAADMQRVPYAAEVALNDLAPGAYVLQLTVIDKLAKASVTRRLDFRIE